MIAATTVVGIDVSRDWLDGFWFPAERRFGLPNSAEGHEQLIAAIRELPGAVKFGFEATGGQEWCSGPHSSRQGSRRCNCPRHRSRPLPFRGARASCGNWFAAIIGRSFDRLTFVLSSGARILRALTTRRAQIVDMRKRLLAQVAARKKQDVSAAVEGMDEAAGHPGR